METIIRDIHGIRRIRIFVTCGIEGDADILRVGVFPVLTCLRILQPLVFYQIWKAEPGVMVEVDHFNMLMASDHTDGRYHLFQSLVVLVLIGAEGVVLRIVDVDEVASLQGRDQHDGSLLIQLMQFIQDDTKGPVDGTVAGIVGIVSPVPDPIGIPPVVGAYFSINLQNEV